MRNYLAIGSASPSAFFFHQHVSSARLLPHNLWGGVFSRNPDTSVSLGTGIGSIGFRDYDDMIAAAKQANVSYGLVTLPNVGHFPAARKLVEGGIPVLLEKPITMDLPEARELKQLADAAKVPIGVAYTYQNFWAASLGALLGRSGRLGRVCTFVGQYLQEWQLGDLGILQEWRQDPLVSGRFNCGGDILTHIVQLVRACTAQEVAKVIGVTQIVGPVGRPEGEVSKRTLDDDAQTMVQLSGGRWGILKASQVACGHANGCRVEISFEKGAIVWEAETPEVLIVHLADGGTREYKRGRNFDGDPLVADLCKQIVTPPLPPGGHNTGFRDALATMHHRMGLVVDDWEKSGKSAVPTDWYGLANLYDGEAGMSFLDALARSVDGGNAVVAV